MTAALEAGSMEEAGQLFHALSDPTRLQILAQLGDGECCVCEMTDALDVAQSRLSFHLRVLRDAGFITSRREGRWSYYTANHDAWPRLEALVSDLRPRRRARPGRDGCC